MLYFYSKSKSTEHARTLTTTTPVCQMFLFKFYLPYHQQSQLDSHLQLEKLLYSTSLVSQIKSNSSKSRNPIFISFSFCFVVFFLNRLYFFLPSTCLYVCKKSFIFVIFICCCAVVWMHELKYMCITHTLHEAALPFITTHTHRHLDVYLCQIRVFLGHHFIITRNIMLQSLKLHLHNLHKSWHLANFFRNE